MTPQFPSRFLSIIRSSIIIFGMVVGTSISTNAETVKVTDGASADGSFIIAQTTGMDRAKTAGTPGRTAVNTMGLSARTNATANSKDASRGRPNR